MPLFTLKHVKYKNIVEYPDIEIMEKASTFICGESGSGKSTLLKLLNGVISPSAGSITYLGKDIEDYESIKLRREVLLVSQAVYLFDMSVRDNFKEYYAYLGTEPLRDKAIEHYLNICSINFPLDAMCTTMSGGERQRLFIAISLSLQSKVLMLDEPTSALDDKNANALMANIKDFCAQNGKTLLVVSHNRSIADTFADNIVSLSGSAHTIQGGVN